MANENMIKFYRGLVSNLPATGVNGALYITTDEGAIYYGTGTGMKRLGDFIQVANVAALPEKAHESCLYYCVAENILAKWNGSEWKQINKQPTAEELKGLLGLGSLAYKSEVAESDLSAELAEKVNAASEGNHSHANKALLDTYTQTEADLADAVAKKHAHANADELAKIVDGDKAKWDAVAADHLTSADKTTLENSIKEAKKAGTDANTALETYKVTNDARVLAVEEDVAEITNVENGILAQAKTYSDGKLATARTEISAEIDADVKVVADDLAGYKTSNDTALAGVKATAEAAAVKTEVESALAGKVDKVEGKSLISDSEITRLASVTNYDDTQVKADIATKAGTEYVNTELGKKVDKVEGYSLVSDTEIARLADVDNYDDAEVRGLIGDNAEAIEALETYVGTIPTDYTETTVISYINKKAEETLAAAQGGSSETAASVKQQLDNYKSENDTRVKAAEDAIDAIEADYLTSADKTELSGLITAEKERAEGIEAGLRTDVDAIKGDYLKASDKTELQGNIDTVSAAVERLTNGVSADEVDGVNDLINYVNEHGTEVTGMKADIKANADAIDAINNESTGILAQAKGYADGLAGNYAEAEHDHVVADITDFDTAVAGKIEAYGYATTGYADSKAADAQSAAEATAAGALASARTEITAEIDADVKALADGAVATNAANISANTEAIATKANVADVYAKTETFTKEEVAAAISAAIEEAHTWGSF